MFDRLGRVRQQCSDCGRWRPTIGLTVSDTHQSLARIRGRAAKGRYEGTADIAGDRGGCRRHTPAERPRASSRSSRTTAFYDSTDHCRPNAARRPRDPRFPKRSLVAVARSQIRRKLDRPAAPYSVSVLAGRQAAFSRAGIRALRRDQTLPCIALASRMLEESRIWKLPRKFAREGVRFHRQSSFALSCREGASCVPRFRSTNRLSCRVEFEVLRQSCAVWLMRPKSRVPPETAHRRVAGARTHC